MLNRYFERLTKSKTFKLIVSSVVVLLSILWILQFFLSYWILVFNTGWFRSIDLSEVQIFIFRLSLWVVVLFSLFSFLYFKFVRQCNFEKFFHYILSNLIHYVFFILELGIGLYVGVAIFNAPTFLGFNPLLIFLLNGFFAFILLLHLKQLVLNFSQKSQEKDFYIGKYAEDAKENSDWIIGNFLDSLPRKTDKIEIKYWSFPAGKTTHPRKHQKNALEVNLILRGHIQGEINNRPVELKAGQYVVVPAGIPNNIVESVVEEVEGFTIKTPSIQGDTVKHPNVLK